jgi:hypothetical protein
MSVVQGKRRTGEVLYRGSIVQGKRRVKRGSVLFVGSCIAGYFD